MSKDDIDLVRTHIQSLAATTFHEPSGALGYPYIVPGGFYSQLWCWDAVFAGIGGLRYGSACYLVGSCLNFFAATAEDGSVPGCLTPSGFSLTLKHAKPVLIWGALAAARATGDFGQFAPWRAAMAAQLRYWSAKRKDSSTGLYVWHDVMESGADNLPFYEPPSAHTPGWDEAVDALRVASPDLQTFLSREHTAFAVFLETWAAARCDEASSGSGMDAAELLRAAAAHRAEAAAIAAATCKHLWHPEPDDGKGCVRGYFVAYDVRAGTQLVRRTYQVAWPLWLGPAGAPSAAAREAALDALTAPDLLGAAGLRSLSSSDARYTLEDVIVPYSNWRGPVWVNVNAVAAYTLAACGRRAAALDLARRLVAALAQGLRVHGSFFECYDPDSGSPLAAASKGFFSWTILAADLIDDIEASVDPFRID